MLLLFERKKQKGEKEERKLQGNSLSFHANEEEGEGKKIVHPSLTTLPANKIKGKRNAECTWRSHLRLSVSMNRGRKKKGYQGNKCSPSSPPRQPQKGEKGS